MGHFTNPLGCDLRATKIVCEANAEIIKVYIKTSLIKSPTPLHTGYPEILFWLLKSSILS